MTSVDFRYAPSSSWTAICRPDDTEKTLVREDGALLYGYRRGTWLTYAFDRVIEVVLADGTSPLSVSQQTETPRSAIVETRLRYPQVELELRTFRHHRDGRSFDVVSWHAQVNDEIGERPVSLQIEIFDRRRFFTSGPRGASARVYAVDNEQDDAVEWWYDPRDPAAANWRPATGELILTSYPQRLAAAQPRGFRPVAAFATLPEHLEGGAAVRGFLVVSLDGAEPEDLDPSWLDRALELERDYWANLFPRGLPLQVPDADIQSLLDAAARNLLQARERRGEHRVFQVGHAVYRDFWIADSYFMLEAARYLGLDDAADESLAALEGYVAEDGSIAALGEVGHIKETAIAIAAVVRQAELAGRRDDLERWWPRIDRAAEHILALHESTFELPEDSPARGLMPAAFGDGGVAGRRAEYTTILWSLAGLRLVIGAAERANYPGRRRYREIYDHLWASFDQHRRRNMRALADGCRYLPMVLDGGSHHIRPDSPALGPEDELRPETATWALAHAIHPGEIFAPDDELVAAYLDLLDRIDGAEHVPATTGWLPYRALWTYYASFAAHAQLWAGRPTKAVEYLYGFANHAAPTRVWREEQPLRDAGHATVNGDMPHNWASAELIRLVRNLLVFEREQQLDLLPALPTTWLQPAKTTRIATPTRYGQIRLEITAGDPTGRIELELPPLNPPDEVLLHVPAGRWSIRQRNLERSITGPALLRLPETPDSETQPSMHGGGG